MKRHRTAVLGLGVRGKTHLKALLANPEYFEIVGLCDIDIQKAKSIQKEFHLQEVPVFSDGEEMLKSVRPEVFVFVTYPDLRLSMVELAVRYQVKAISLEKPMAESLSEARKMRDLCLENGIKAVVCHQQKYLSQMQELKRKLDEGRIGKITKIHVETQPWIAQLGTHYIDYSIWVNGGCRAKWVVGHIHGPATLADNHPSPDYMLGEIGFENGTRAYIECGYLSEQHNPDMYRDTDNRITVYGTDGYLYAETDGFWGECSPQTGGHLVTGKNPGWYHHQEKEIQIPYYTEYGKWLNDDALVHSCNIETATHGYEILEGMCISALDNIRVDLPMQDVNYQPVLERMKNELPECGTKLLDLYDGKAPRQERD